MDWFPPVKFKCGHIFPGVYVCSKISCFYKSIIFWAKHKQIQVFQHVSLWRFVNCICGMNLEHYFISIFKIQENPFLKEYGWWKLRKYLFFFFTVPGLSKSFYSQLPNNEEWISFSISHLRADDCFLLLLNVFQSNTFILIQNFKITLEATHFIYLLYVLLFCFCHLADSRCSVWTISLWVSGALRGSNHTPGALKSQKKTP